uniref:DUF2987 domain-containing protein n=1 Tax=Thaumasiovibrio occultus TaxID=1891184 RepID=UPI000B354CC5|nr:DUF2987 domain-containing protein [Thaumasiovibrio occultus]
MARMQERAIALIAMFAALSNAAIAEQTYEFRYSQLYSPMKHNHTEDFPDVEVQLRLIETGSGDVCFWSEGWMRKDEHYEAFSPTSDGQLFLPLDAHLRRVNPDVAYVVNTVQTCDMQMQVLSTNAVADYAVLLDQFSRLYQELSGSDEMPAIVGLTYHTPDQTYLVEDSEGVAALDLTQVVKITPKFQIR